MKTQTQQTDIFSSQLLTDTAQMIKDAGMDVYYSVWKHSANKRTYFHFTDGVNIGYCQQAYFGGISFTTVHKPCPECGTGFGIIGDPGTISPTIADAKKAFIIAPNWASSKDKNAVKKYRDWEEYVSKNSQCEYFKF